MKTTGRRRGPGRPPAAESKDRIETIIAIARRHFAAKGLDATTLSDVAADAGISLAALYHYVDTKASLYEVVFRETLTATWGAIVDRLAQSAPADTYAAQIAALVAAIDQTRTADSNSFLVAAPIEILRHPELSHLLAERDRVRDRVLRAVVEPPFRSDTTSSLTTLDDAVTAVRLVFAGWALESVLRPEQEQQFTGALLHLVGLLDRAGQSAGDDSAGAAAGAGPLEPPDEPLAPAGPRQSLPKPTRGASVSRSPRTMAVRTKARPDDSRDLASHSKRSAADPSREDGA